MSRRGLLLGLVLLGGCGDAGDGVPADEVCEVAPGTGPTLDLDGPLCTYLSSYRLFTDLPSQTADPALIPYDLNTPLFSDYAEKQRWIWLPDGASLTWSDDATLAMPVGTVIVKTFAYPIDARDPALGRQLLETRVMVHRADGWEGASYAYQPGAHDAVLASGARTIDASWIDASGTTRTNQYVTPSKNQCINCHAETVDTMGPIGPKARHLNRPFPTSAGPTFTGNQLQALIDRGALTGAPTDPATWPAVIPFDDVDPGTLEARARGWLDINCAHCHSPTGAARTSGLFLTYGNDDLFSLGVCKPPVAAGQGSGGRDWDIVPGAPDESILVYRLEGTAADVKMPELGRNLVFDEGVALIRAWITSLDGSCEAPP